MDRSQLVSVVIPVFNGRETISYTIESVIAQSYRPLEIIVVDDGSTDGTAEIVELYARDDQRITLLRQTNAGVAAARNRGIAAAAPGGLVALIDADDLWSPTKIEKQVAALTRLGPQAVLCYTWSEIFNECGTIIEREAGPCHAGDVLAAICGGNFIGNGSAVLMRRDAVLAVGGYDSSLQSRGAQGCEDFLLYFRMARAGQFAVVPEYLTRYRRRSGSMSADARRMLRSWMLVREEICQCYPASAPALRANLLSYLTWLHRNAVLAGNLHDAAFAAWQLARRDPSRALRTVFSHISLLTLFARRDTARQPGLR